MTSMSTAPHKLMTVEEFLSWAEDRPGRYELHDGRIVAMSPERVGHASVKGAIFRALTDALVNADLRCHVLPDGVAVRVSETRWYEPDALVYCGAEAARDSIQIDNPMIVVEVLSPSTAQRDIHAKLAGYFSVPSVMHYLIVDPESPPVVHHKRQDDGTILTRLIPSGEIKFDPPGFVVTAESLFA